MATIEQGEQANQVLQQRLQSDRQIIASVQKERDDARSELQRAGEVESRISELKRQLGDAIREEAKLRSDLQNRDDKIAAIISASARCTDSSSAFTLACRLASWRSLSCA